MAKRIKKNQIENHSGNQVPKQSRRDFINTAWKGLGIVAGIEFVGLTTHYLIDRKNRNNIENMYEAGLPDEFPINSVTPFRKGSFYLVRLQDGGFIAMSLKCSHLGCAIIWDEKINEFICPCHSSKFDITGKVKSPPAPRALDVYDIILQEGKIYINLSKKIKRDGFDNSQLTYI